MKKHEASTQRFVREYANYKISIFKSLAETFPDKAESLNGNCVYISRMVDRWDAGMILTDEVMELIAKA